MPIELGRGRGFMQPNGQMKVSMPSGREAVWVKIIAMHNSKIKAIGILMNNPFQKDYSWGDFVRIEDLNRNTIGRIIGHATKIPNNQNWQLLER